MLSISMPLALVRDSRSHQQLPICSVISRLNVAIGRAESSYAKIWRVTSICDGVRYPFKIFSTEES